MENLLTGYLFTVMALSLSEGIGSIINAASENLKTTINLSTARKQLEINKLALAQENMENTRAIGFALPQDDEGEYDDDDERDT